MTELQKKCSQFIKGLLTSHQDGLVWAVCGAGKTEITFLAIEQVVINYGCVCFAIPRIDILYEIAQRLKWFFPNVEIAVINSKEKKVQHAQIYVITTNQILRFKQAFDLIIIDEVDAYPYEYNLKFEYGTKTAKKFSGSIIYLTSTPSPKIQDKKLPTFIINRRWHGYDLPVPEFEFLFLNLINFT